MSTIERNNKSKTEEAENPTLNASISDDGDDRTSHCEPSAENSKHCFFILREEGCLWRFVGFVFMALVVFFGGLCAGYFGFGQTEDTAFALMAIGLTAIYWCIWFVIFWVVKRKKNKDSDAASGDDIEVGRQGQHGEGITRRKNPIMIHISTFVVGTLASVLFLMGFFVIFKGVANDYDTCYVPVDALDPNPPCLETISVGIVLVFLSHIFFAAGMCMARSFVWGKQVN